MLTTLAETTHLSHHTAAWSLFENLDCLLEAGLTIGTLDSERIFYNEEDLGEFLPLKMDTVPLDGIDIKEKMKEVVALFESLPNLKAPSNELRRLYADVKNGLYECPSKVVDAVSKIHI